MISSRVHQVSHEYLRFLIVLCFMSIHYFILLWINLILFMSMHWYHYFIWKNWPVHTFVVTTILLTLRNSDMFQPSKGHLQGVQQKHFNSKVSKMSYQMCGYKMSTRCNRGFLLPILLLATVRHVHIHTITPYKRDTWPTDQAIHYRKPTKNTHTRPPRHSSHLVTNLDNTRHLRLRTHIPKKLTKLLFTFLQHEIPQTASTV